ncbi:MarR family winged helix-turn-helix transcriptional regulator [Nocardia seriolae]|uniref:Transcriptional regulator n=1 Tax=Nocardia seriolae TaxID=37332 RepID=A0A0B8MZ71_9NOCA|nr:MarR family transcriptional regulator [Nocardia seriolae]APB01744.1 putative HTH-type transcriptional regulator YxaD [Nocardia seriolae]MTJ60800.1 MarR family transcriptional regulator [Nocardia seriolae]MTJ70263.1 MarR family transcriptional regulator [Nocardia seriolae]MTJ91057.1 MarR family transcriptional regulator [Nocardia seriolae]MTK35019.1 MarR family transcriptional regulator [Nocardia seriolae]
MDQPADASGKPTARVEFETMLLGRYTINARYRRDGTRLDRSAYVLLSRLAVTGPMSIGQLTEAFGLDTSTVNRQTAALLRGGLVDRIPDPVGGIARKFHLTAAGEAALDAERRANTEGLDRVMETWSADDVAAFANLLARFNTDIERLDGRPWPRP